jgi:hypothetical protein
VNPRHYLAHVLLRHHPPEQAERPALAEAVTEHVRRALSVESVTASLREKLVKRRQREALLDELDRLSRELTIMGVYRDERIEGLRQKVQELKKKVGPTGPLP